MLQDCRVEVPTGLLVLASLGAFLHGFLRQLDALSLLQVCQLLVGDDMTEPQETVERTDPDFPLLLRVSDQVKGPTLGDD